MMGWWKLHSGAGRVRCTKLDSGRWVRLSYTPLEGNGGRARFGTCPWTRGATGTGSVTVEAWAPPIMDQGETSSCEGHRYARCIGTAFAAAGAPLGFVPSPAEIYRNGRAIDRLPDHNGNFAPLTDDGSMTANVSNAVRLFGVRPIGPMAPDGRYSDCFAETINHEPMLTDLIAEHRTLPIGERFISDCTTGRDASAVIQDMRASLALKYPVGIAAYVDTAWMNWRPGYPPMGACNYDDTNGGGHAISILEVNGDDTVWVDNSWGTGWGAEGRILCSPDFIAQCIDISSFVPELAQ